MNIFEKALSGGLAAIIVYAIYWGIHLLLNRKGSTLKASTNNEPARGNTQTNKGSMVEPKQNLPNLNDAKVRFNYYYAFKWIPEKVNLYKKRSDSILTVTDVATIIREHPEFSQVASKVEYALSQNDQNPSMKVVAISIPNSGAVSEVVIAYIVFVENTHDVWYFTMENTVEDGYAKAMPASTGDHKLIGFVKDAKEFVEKALEIVMAQSYGENKTLQNQRTNAVEDPVENSYKTKATDKSIDFNSLSGLTEQRFLGEVASVLKIAHVYIKDRLGQMPIINETTCYLIGASFLYPYIPNSFLLKSISYKFIPYFNDWTQRRILTQIEDLNEGRPSTSMSLLDFAKAKGNMRIETGVRIDGEFGKYASFQKFDDELSRIEVLFDLPHNMVNAKSIEENRDKLRVKQVKEIYYIYHKKSDEEYIKNYNLRIYYLLYGVYAERIDFNSPIPEELESETKYSPKIQSIYNLMKELENKIIEQAKLLNLIK